MGERSFSVSGSGYVFFTTSLWALRREAWAQHCMRLPWLKCRREGSLCQVATCAATAQCGLENTSLPWMACALFPRPNLIADMLE